MPAPVVTTPYVFPASARESLGIAVATRFKEMLLQGAPSVGKAGLNVRPVFRNREGKGGGRDASLNTKAQVIFFDDLRPGTPYVVILGIRRDDTETWGDDDEQEIMTCTAALDCVSNQFVPKTTTKGVDAATAHAVLGNFVEDFLNHRDAMTTWGFCEPRVRPEGPAGAMDNEGLPMKFHYPLMVQFEIYVER
jgi:hypothetical protein